MSKPEYNLYGYQCPQCGQYKRFQINAKILLQVEDYETMDIGDHIWDETDYCYCPFCEWTGTIADVKEAGKGNLC